MAYKKEPCPLCGRDMIAIETHVGRGELYCGHCDLTIGGNDAKTPQELIELMNRSEHRRLKAKNAKLREQLDTAEHNRKRNFREYARMCHENDKLRELVVRMARVLNVGGECCDRDCEKEFDCKYICRIADAMCELGVEVDE